MSDTTGNHSPFPGMDPFLEANEIWPGFLHGLAEAIVDQLNPAIGPKYYADVSLRTVGETVQVGMAHVSYPDVGVYERLGATTTAGAGRVAVEVPPAPVRRTVPLAGQIRLRAVHVYRTGADELIATIELLSPYNKRRGEGLEEYRAKRARLLSSTTHLIEVDLLRGGERPGPEVLEPPLNCDYVALVNRFSAAAPRESEIWPIAVTEPLPLLPVPLLPPDRDAVLDLGQVVQGVYARRGYGWRIDYRQPLPPPDLRPGVSEWVRERLRSSQAPG